MTTQKGMQNIINKNTLLINQSALSLGHSLSLCGPVPLCKPPVTEAVYVATGKAEISESAKTSQSSLHTTDSKGPDHSGDPYHSQALQFQWGVHTGRMHSLRQ